jgi:protein-disulfide isomerase
VVWDLAATVVLRFFLDLSIAQTAVALGASPICRDFAIDSLTQLVSKEVRAGKVKVVYRSFCTATCNGPGPKVFETQQAAAYAAGVQHLFWDYALLFYREQGEEGTHYATASYLTGLAKQIPGLNLVRWQTDCSSPGPVAQVEADERVANSQGLNSTPTLFVQGPKGRQQIASEVPTYSELERAIKRVQ